MNALFFFPESLAPVKRCNNPKGFGCCWDGTPALRPNGGGCRRRLSYFAVIYFSFYLFLFLFIFLFYGAQYMQSFVISLLACVDTSKHVCTQFVVRDRYNRINCGATGAWYTRTYLEKACPRTCKRCRKYQQINLTSLVTEQYLISVFIMYSQQLF